MAREQAVPPMSSDPSIQLLERVFGISLKGESGEDQYAEVDRLVREAKRQLSLLSSDGLSEKITRYLGD